MENVIESKKCTGCTACFNICPNNAIVMEDDKYGFKYPRIDKEKCVNCGLCEKVCPILEKNKKELYELQAYAAFNNNDENRRNSSSGGMFILLAREILKRNGVVFGAALDENNIVRHDYVEESEQLYKFMGSKYVQSNVGNSYKKAKEFLDAGRYVLFTGTPCQIEGIKKYLRKEYDKLYTQDIICHGVPSPLAWEKYKEYRKKKDGKIPDKIEFRNKDIGWKKFCIKFNYNDEVPYIKALDKDIYMQTFLKNTILRDSCYKCNFKTKDRVSDITLADFWGVKNVVADFDDDKGTSLIIVQSKKGKEIFELIKNEIKFQKVNIEDALKYNMSMVKSVVADKKRNDFFENINKCEYDELYEKYCSRDTLFKKILNKIKRIIKKIVRK